MPASGTQQLAYSATLPQSIFRQLQTMFSQGPNFGPAQQAFSNNYSHPSLQLGPNGSWLDPSQTNLAQEQNYQGARGDIATQDLQNKQQLAPLFTKAGGIMANLANYIPYIQAANLGGAGSLAGTMSGFGGL